MTKLQYERYRELAALLTKRGVAWLVLVEGSSFEDALVAMAKAAGSELPELVLGSTEGWREGITK